METLSALLALWEANPPVLDELLAQRANHAKLKQLERLRSEDTHRRFIITYTIESYWIPSQKKTKSKLQI